MIITENDRLRITGQDEVILSIVLFILNLFLDEKAFARTYLGMALKYFRDLGLPLDRWLFDRILGTWDTKLAYGTPARTIPFPQDARDPVGGEIVIYKMRRREFGNRCARRWGTKAIWRLREWIRNSTEIGGDLPSGEAMLDLMAMVLGPELLDRLAMLSEADADTETSEHDHLRVDDPPDPIRLEGEFKKDLRVGFGSRKITCAEQW